MMRTTLTLDDGFVQNLMRITGEKNHAAAIRHALQDYLRQAHKQNLLALRGAVEVEDCWRDLRTLDVAK